MVLRKLIWLIMTFWVFVLDSTTGKDGAQFLSASEGRVALPPCIGNGATSEAMRPFTSQLQENGKGNKTSSLAHDLSL